MQVCSIRPTTISRLMPCLLSSTSKSVLAKPLEHQCSWATMSPGCGSKSGCSSPPRPCGLLNRRDVLPRLVVARAVAAMQRVENPDIGRAGGVEDLAHVRDTLVGFGDGLQAVPNFAALGNEIVVRIDHEEAGE